MERLYRFQERDLMEGKIIGAPRRALTFPAEQLFIDNDGDFMDFANQKTN